MTDGDVKGLSSRASSPDERKEAIDKALRAGLTLAEIEAALDLSDAILSHREATGKHRLRSWLSGLLRAFLKKPPVPSARGSLPCKSQ